MKWWFLLEFTIISRIGSLIEFRWYPYYVLSFYFSILEQCSVERLARMAAMQPEMAVQERNLDHYLDLLKANRLDENSSLEPLEKMSNYFQVQLSSKLTKMNNFHC